VTDLAERAAAFADAVEQALPSWVAACVERVYGAFAGEVPEPVRTAAQAAGTRARHEIGPRMRQLLETDIDEQRTTPLALMREAARYPSLVLASAGVPPVQRDRFGEATFPDDRYGLCPASWSEVGPELQELSLEWGAAKAWAHMQRHRRPS
jgi:hypothetical protein